MKIILELHDEKLKRGFADFPKANVQAVKNTLNIAVSLTRRNAITDIRTDFILRNKFTERQIQFDKAEGDDISMMESRIGATEKADYMATQEEGGRRKLSQFSKGATSIPQTPVRIGLSSHREVSRDYYIKRLRKKIVRGRFRKNFGSSKARMVAMFAAGKKLNKLVKRHGDILRVSQFEKLGRNRVKIRTELLYTLYKKPILIKPNPWLEPATHKPARDLENIYKVQLRKFWKTGEFE